MGRLCSLTWIWGSLQKHQSKVRGWDLLSKDLRITFSLIFCTETHFHLLSKFVFAHHCHQIFWSGHGLWTTLPPCFSPALQWPYETRDHRGNHDPPPWCSTRHCGIASLGNGRASWVHPYFKMDRRCPFIFLGAGFHFKPFESLFCWRVLDDFERKYFQYSGAGHGMPTCSQPSASSLVAIPFSGLNLDMSMGVYMPTILCLAFLKISLRWIFIYYTIYISMIYIYIYIYVLFIYAYFRWIIIHVFLMAWLPITVDSTLRPAHLTGRIHQWLSKQRLM